ncbi:hypothetical protein [Vibrio sonorensis]|uniref:hypothetical protein n=1 Tax=Vibrio sonorensis TaxID=1004316 RepID=UPI001585DC99|nr:hypothetical protein [Vibrio sonorensis]
MENASHGLLKADQFGGQNLGVTDWFKMIWMGESALTPEFVPTLLKWLDDQKL